MDMNDVLRANIRRRRKEVGSQEQVAMAMTRRTGSPWSKQLVSRVETGGRRLDMNELVLLARVLGTTVVELLRPLGEVELSPRETRSADEVFHTVAPDVADMTRALEQIRAATYLSVPQIDMTLRAYEPEVVSNEEE